tara:strand:+ start:1373 stop:1573 length:201 start_codon:yes stop_codon:yes gene_type:complete
MSRSTTQRPTKEQQEMFIEAISDYPQGVPSCAWGWGPMAETESGASENAEYEQPGSFTDAVQREYG